MTFGEWVILTALMVVIFIVSWWLGLLLLPFVLFHVYTYHKATSAGWIYYISDDEARLIKIGRSKNPPAGRMRQLSGQSPHKLRLIHAYKVNDMLTEEKRLHEKYAEFRRHGEWFDVAVFEGPIPTSG